MKTFSGGVAVKKVEFFFLRACDTSDTLACDLRKVDMRHDHTRISGFSFDPCKLGTASKKEKRGNNATAVFHKCFAWAMEITRLKYFRSVQI